MSHVSLEKYRKYEELLKQDPHNKFFQHKVHKYKTLNDKINSTIGNEKNDETSRDIIKKINSIIGGDPNTFQELKDNDLANLEKIQSQHKKKTDIVASTIKELQSEQKTRESVDVLQTKLKDNEAENVATKEKYQKALKQLEQIQNAYDSLATAIGVDKLTKDDNKIQKATELMKKAQEEIASQKQQLAELESKKSFEDNNITIIKQELADSKQSIANLTKVHNEVVDKMREAYINDYNSLMSQLNIDTPQ